VDDPRFDGLACGHCLERISGRFEPNRMIVPWRVECEMMQSLMLGVCAIRICTCSGGDRLQALALAFAEDAERVDGEGSPPLGSPQHCTDAVEVLSQPL